MSTILLLLLLLSICQMSTQTRASVTIEPNSSQFFEYNKVSVSCKQFGSGGWTVWRYTTDGKELSQCGSGWGGETSSICEMKTVKLANSGVYWCESKHKESSNAINVTVMSGGSVILVSPALPVSGGQDIPLTCQMKTSSHKAEFFKDGALIQTEATDLMTIRNFSKSNEGAYKCRIGDIFSKESWLLMKDDSEPVSLTVVPDSSQFTEYERLVLSCGGFHQSQGWNIKRWTTGGSAGPSMSLCGRDWGPGNASHCELLTAKQSDSGVYWCESVTRQRSNSVNITIYPDKHVILKSPVLPVMEGNNVTLNCVKKPNSHEATFYKGDTLIRTEPAGQMIIYNVKPSDEGLYKCHIRGHGESPSSWLFVRASNSEKTLPHSGLSLGNMIRYIVVLSFPYFVSTLLAVSIYRQRKINRHRTTGRNKPVPKVRPPPRGENKRLDQQPDDVMPDDVTTEHSF
ncbi:sialoadhesin-like [Mugil cephalus]|uniref:sialoadhesin-like n=1 Tax=Mugil cephalus TaxID=48193 RepID=UPI001FB77501|nr:sialoadhesin-like [Mugil cephalus]